MRKILTLMALGLALAFHAPARFCEKHQKAADVET